MVNSTRELGWRELPPGRCQVDKPAASLHPSRVNALSRRSTVYGRGARKKARDQPEPRACPHSPAWPRYHFGRRVRHSFATRQVSRLRMSAPGAHARATQYRPRPVPCGASPRTMFHAMTSRFRQSDFGLSDISSRVRRVLRPYATAAKNAVDAVSAFDRVRFTKVLGERRRGNPRQVRDEISRSR